MGAIEIGTEMVAQVSQRESEAAFVKKYYADNIVSIEGGANGDMPARMEGIDAIHAKHQWWYDNNEVHSTVAEGPFIGNRQDQFAIRFVMDHTPSDGERSLITEVALYTVADDKIVQEEYLYLMG